jgi:Raf kinase inhibitor-like YbhB/YbcL family protein
MLSYRTAGAAIIVFLLSAVALPPEASAAGALEIFSTAVAAGEPIPPENTCTGVNLSPPLSWSDAPAGTKSFALVVADPDAPSGVFYHWVAYNLPASSTGLPPAVAPSSEMADGGTQGVNSFGAIGYKGPCPPHGKPHHYHFRLFALDSKLDLRPGADATELEAAMKGHTLASADLVGTFER